MAMFKGITDITSNLGGLLAGARGLLDKAGGEGLGQGFKGMVQQALDLNVDGLMQAADAHLGTGVMKLTVAGDQEGVKTVVRFRNYAMMRILEIRDMRDIINRFISDDPDEFQGALGEMSDFLDGKEPEMVCSEREMSLHEEIKKLRKMMKQMNTFLEGEEIMLGEEAPVEEERPTLRPVRNTPTAAGIIIAAEKSGNGPRKK
jgi:hypothetical protein